MSPKDVPGPIPGTCDCNAIWQRGIKLVLSWFLDREIILDHEVGLRQMRTREMSGREGLSLPVLSLKMEEGP